MTVDDHTAYVSPSTCDISTTNSRICSKLKGWLLLIVFYESIIHGVSIRPCRQMLLLPEMDRLLLVISVSFLNITAGALAVATGADKAYRACRSQQRLATCRNSCRSLAKCRYSRRTLASCRYSWRSLARAIEAATAGSIGSIWTPSSSARPRRRIQPLVLGQSAPMRLRRGEAQD